MSRLKYDGMVSSSLVVEFHHQDVEPRSP